MVHFPLQLLSKVAAAEDDLGWGSSQAMSIEKPEAHPQQHTGARFEGAGMWHLLRGERLFARFEREEGRRKRMRSENKRPSSGLREGVWGIHISFFSRATLIVGRFSVGDAIHCWDICHGFFTPTQEEQPSHVLDTIGNPTESNLTRLSDSLGSKFRE